MPSAGLESSSMTAGSTETIRSHRNSAYHQDSRSSPINEHLQKPQYSPGVVELGGPSSSFVQTPKSSLQPFVHTQLWRLAHPCFT